MTLTTLNIRRILAGIALVASLGAVLTWGPFSIGMLDTGWGQAAAVLAAGALGATWLPFTHRAVKALPLVLALVIAGVDTYLWYSIATVDDTLFGKPMPGWGLMLQTVACLALLGQPLVQLVRERRAAAAVQDAAL